MRCRRLIATVAAFLLGGCGAGSTYRPNATSPGPELTQIVASVATPAPEWHLTIAQFIDTSHGWMYGCLGSAPVPSCSLLRTADGGRKWTTLPVSQRLLAFTFKDEHSGWLLALQGEHLTVFSTVDGGATLHAAALLPITYDSSLPSPPVIVALNATAGYVVEGSQIAMTTDGWKTFVVRAAPTGVDNAVRFLSSSLGFAVTPQGIDATTTGGLSWHAVFRLPQATLGWAPSGSISPGGLAFSGAAGYASFNIANCWAGGCPELIAASYDHGAHWQLVSAVNMGPIPGWNGSMLGPEGGVVSLTAASPGTIIASNMEGIATSEDRGRTWQEISLMQSGPFASISVADGVTYALADQPASVLLRRSAPDGAWQYVFPSVSPQQSIDFVHGDLGYGVGLYWDPSAVLRTTDGGAKWTVVSSAPKGTFAVSFADGSHGVAMAYGLNLSRTVDGGTNWAGLWDQSAFAAFFTHGDGLALRYEQGVLAPQIYSLNLAKSAPQPIKGAKLPVDLLKTGLDAYALGFGTPTSGWFLFMRSGKPSLWRTLNAGRTWTKVLVPVQLHGKPDQAWLAAAGKDTVWIAIYPAGSANAESVILLHSTDGGQHWTLSRLPGWMVNNEPNSQILSATSGEDAWLITPDGVYRTTDGGKHWTQASQ